MLVSGLPHLLLQPLEGDKDVRKSKARYLHNQQNIDPLMTTAHSAVIRPLVLFISRGIILIGYNSDKDGQVEQSAIR